MSDILMKGTEPIGQVAGLTADNVEYSEGVSVKSVLDVQEITTANLSAFADSTKIKIFQMDKFVQISFNGAKVASNVGRYGELIKSLPTNIQNVYASNYVAKLTSGTTTPALFYLNPNSNKMQTDVAISTTDEIWGSMSYLCQ